MASASKTHPREDALSATFAALADPTRRAMLARLTRGEATVTQLAAPFAISLPAVSRHLKVLESAGLVTKSRTAQYRPCRLDTEQLKRVDEWMAPYRAFFDERLNRLEQHLAAMVASDGAAADKEGKHS
jgi:DNA-binding transcriptional ArsR family regulator